MIIVVSFIVPYYRAKKHFKNGFRFIIIIFYKYICTQAKFRVV